MPARVISAAVASVLGFLMLCGLGAWQLQRLSWKEALIGRIEEKLAAPAIPLETLPAESDADFTKVTVTGTYLPDQTKFVISTHEGGPGWEVVTPLVTAANAVILVDRGVIPAAKRDAMAAEPAGAPQTVTGILRRHAEPRGPFSPDNDEAGNNWYWWDLPAMLAATRAPAGSRLSGVVLQRLPEAGDNVFPRPQAPTANLRNNHLQYAITWFSLAAVLAVIAIIFIRGQMRKTIP